MHARLRSRRGFLLIEALVAFAILAISLSQLLNGVSGGVRNEARADFLLRASRQGASHLDALSFDGPGSFGESNGRYPDGLSWFLSVSPGQGATRLADGRAMSSFVARLVIKKPAGQGEVFTLSTVMLKRDPTRPSQ